MDYRGQTLLPAGLQNNNPGDIRTGDSWLGMAGSSNGFVVFIDSVYGLRALAVDLTNVYENDGLTTVTEIVTHYAPPSENDTASYIENVAASMGVDADVDINLSADPSVLPALMRAIIDQELGGQYSAMVSDNDIQQGILLIPATSVGTDASAASPSPSSSDSSGAAIPLFVIGIAVVAAIVFGSRNN